LTVEVRVTVGVIDGVVNPLGIVTTMYAPDLRTPVAEVVKLTVQVDAAPAASEVGDVVVNETAASDSAAVSVGAVPEVGLTGVTSEDVDNRKFVRTSAVPLTTLMVNLAAAEFLSQHVWPLALARVTTITLVCTASVADAVQSVSKLSAADVRVTVGVVVKVVKPVGNVKVIVEPVTRAPLADTVNPIVHVEAASSTNDVGAVPATVKALTAVVVAVIVSPAEGDTAVESDDVATEKFEPP
jgi:hypothetical protein